MPRSASRTSEPDALDAPRGSNIEALLAGNRRAIARAITAFESGAAECASLAAAIAPRLGRAHVIEIGRAHV